jgi:uncharacterized membrane protein
MKQFFKEIFTDAAGRPEIKMILGVPMAIGAIVYGIVSRDWVGFGALIGTALGLMGLTTLGDAVIDKVKQL